MIKNIIVLLLTVVCLTSCQKLEKKEDFYPNGKLMVEKFVRGNRATNKVYHMDGYLIGTYEYKNGKLHGTTKIYTNDGKLFKKIKYRNGEEVSSKVYGDSKQILNK